MGRPVEIGESLIPQQCHGAAGAAAASPLRCSVEALRGPDSEASSTASAGWENVAGLDSQQLEALQKVSLRGLLWQHPSRPISRLLSLHHGGDVEADGNCLFTAIQRAMQLTESPTHIRLQTVRRFLEGYEAADASKREQIDRTIKNLYSPDLAAGWGVHVVQEVKLLVKKSERTALESEIDELMQVGMSRDSAMESLYKERCLCVQDAPSWAKYMSTSGKTSDEYDIVTLLYTEDGLLSVEPNLGGKAAAFGDDIAIEALANEYQRQVFVVQVHGKDVNAESTEGLLFFLPHSPEQEISHSPVFLFMRGTGWCGAGGDHYEPVFTRTMSLSSKDKAAIVL